ncbi:MAG: hypothetical protein WC668_00340 [Patescibacteria group bacterium]|jgi:hypothetical protein
MRTKKNVEAVVSAMGALLTVVVNLVRYIQEFGGNVGQCLYLLAQPEGDSTLRAIAKLIAGLTPAEAGIMKRAAKQIVLPQPVGIVGIYDVTVDPSQDLEQMIAAGKYDAFNPDINNRHFSFRLSPLTRKIRVELLQFNQNFSNGDQVIAKLQEVNDWLAQQGAEHRYRFAPLPELLALGAAHPGLQRLHPIAALGSIWQHEAGHRSFAYLDVNVGRRLLSLISLEYRLYSSWRFAVVREPIPLKP